jgi:hypothetical protein
MSIPMKKRLRLAGLVLFLVLVGIQFIHPKQNLGATGGPNDITVRSAVPDDVRWLLAATCYDCHSNRTRYPWYASVQPVAWWLDHHVREGKRELNFSEFGAYPARRAAHKMAAIVKEVGEGDMPLSSYTWIHPAARLPPDQRKKLVDWAQALHDKIPPE